jgi:tRNA (mo5U34)-methyltransferase
MNVRELEEGIRQLNPWFHDLEVKGVRTAPDHPLGSFLQDLWRLIEGGFPERMDGMTVLDVGCNAGFYSLQLRARGADVLGIDHNPHYLRQARFVADVLGADIEYREMDVYTVHELDRTFDYVLFMGVLYHLRYPLLALDRLAGLVGERLILQSLVRGSQSIMTPEPDYPITERDVFAEPSFPAVYFIEGSYAGDPTNWWVPNDSALMGMLRSAGFQIDQRVAPGVYFCSPAVRC